MISRKILESINYALFLILFVLAITGMIGLASSTPSINEKAVEGKLLTQKSRDAIDLCEILNWDSFYIDHEFIALDWYVAEMYKDGLFTESEANNTISKFLIDNDKRVSETRGRSDIDEYVLFQGVSEIFIQWYVIDLYEEDSFSYNHTYQLVVDKYGINTQPFILQFDTALMTDIVDDFELQYVKPLERCVNYFIWTNALLIGSISLLALWEKKEEKLFHLIFKGEKVDLKQEPKRQRLRIPLNPLLIGPLILTIISAILFSIGLNQILPT